MFIPYTLSFSYTKSIIIFREGMTILDLGCGAGRDVYIASQLVGATGKVIGVDMTEEQLKTARDTQEYHAEKFGYDNVEFHLGLIEKLDDIPSLKDGSVDIIISNCVRWFIISII